jgi:hypothetical protein
MEGFMQEEKIAEQRCPDCITEVKVGNSVLVVNGFLKQDGAVTAADKMLKVLSAESYLTVRKKCC